MMDSYAALVSGVLIGMSDGLQPEAAPDSGRSRKRKPRPRRFTAVRHSPRLACDITRVLSNQ
jgi:hypothetical protein